MLSDPVVGISWVLRCVVSQKYPFLKRSIPLASVTSHSPGFFPTWHFCFFCLVFHSTSKSWDVSEQSWASFSIYIYVSLSRWPHLALWLNDYLCADGSPTYRLVLISPWDCRFILPIACLPPPPGCSVSVPKLTQWNITLGSPHSQGHSSICWL